MAHRLMQKLWHHFSPAQRTLLLVNLASITEKADEALLPAVRLLSLQAPCQSFDGQCCHTFTLTLLFVYFPKRRRCGTCLLGNIL